MKTVFENKFTFLKKSISQQFHSQTKISFFPKKMMDEEKWPPEWTLVNFKGYPRLKRIKLCEFSNLTDKKFESILLSRKSRREMNNRKMAEQELSNLLYFSGGIRKGTKSDTGVRPYASAGSRYPLEIYPVVLNAGNLKKGIYHYHLKTHSLEELWVGNRAIKELFNAFNQEWLNKCSVILLISAVFWRNQVKYGERGYRYVFLDAGHLCQNIYLVTEALNLQCCEVGGFIDDQLHRVLDIDGFNEAVLVAFGVGK